MASGSTRVAEAFCPAHITGFFKAHTGIHNDKMSMGSTGAGFSLATAGVRTRVTVKEEGTAGRAPSHVITTSGYMPDRTDLSSVMVREFLDMTASTAHIEVSHEISVPVGYGLGSSAAAALSLAYALDDALGTRMTREEIGCMAHAAEIECSTGLGDVLAAYHGGFEIRTIPGAPGVGAVETVRADNVAAVVICLAPISTSRFIAERLPMINGLGGGMTDKLRKSRDYGHFQDMSLEFAGHVGVVTPRMQDIIDRLRGAGIRCGVALFGETIFCMAEAGSEGEREAAEIFGQYPDGIVIRSALDRQGARLLRAEGDGNDNR